MNVVARGLKKDIFNLFVLCIELVFSLEKTALSFHFRFFLCILGYINIVTFDAAILLLAGE